MGRSSIMYVMGFNIIFMMMGFSLSHVSTDAYQNYVDYYNRVISYQIVGSAANMAAQEISYTPNWRTGFSETSFQGGTFTVACQDLDSGRVRVTVLSRYGTLRDTAIIVMGLSRFFKFAYFSANEGASIYWATGDTVFGPMHSQSTLKVQGTPVFKGRVTTNGKIDSTSGSPAGHPKFQGGVQTGVNISIPANSMDTVINGAKALGYTFDRGAASNGDLYLMFDTTAAGVGRVIMRKGSWKSAPFKTMRLDSLPQTIIWADSTNVHVKGVVKGRATVASTGGGAASPQNGKIWVDSSVVYSQDPRFKTSSTDFLGLVAKDSILIKDTTAQQQPGGGGIQLFASLFSQTAGLAVQNYNTRGDDGQLVLYGGIQQAKRCAVAQSGGTWNGFRKAYYYDDRLRLDGPPSYPSPGNYIILSWYES